MTRLESIGAAVFVALAISGAVVVGSISLDRALYTTQVPNVISTEAHASSPAPVKANCAGAEPTEDNPPPGWIRKCGAPEENEK